MKTGLFLEQIGVGSMPPRTVTFDPGYDPATFVSQLGQSFHLLQLVKISMATWLIAQESSVREKIRAAHSHGLAVVAGGGPFEIAVACHALDDYLDLCASLEFDRVEAGEGFAASNLNAADVVDRCRARGLAVQFEIGTKFGGTLSRSTLSDEITKGQRWLDAGAEQIVVEAVESAAGVGLFDEDGELNHGLLDELVKAIGNLNLLQFEAPTKASQFALLDYLGPEAVLANVRLEEILRVEIYRRGLHSRSFGSARLRPSTP